MSERSVESSLHTLPQHLQSRFKDHQELLSFVPDMLPRLEQIDPSKPVIYTAGPDGFSDSGKLFSGVHRAGLEDAGVPPTNILDPWDLTPLHEIPSGNDKNVVFDAFVKLNPKIAARNVVAMLASDAITANLDGVDVDSGTAAEIGFVSGNGLPVFGVRTDFRSAGDNIGSVVNLQVEYFIRRNGGRIDSRLTDHLRAVTNFVTDFQRTSNHFDLPSNTTN